MKNLYRIEQAVEFIEQNLENLQQDEAAFLKISGINEQIEQANQDKSEYEEEISKAKEKRDQAKSKKAAAIGKITGKIAAKMNQVLPFGEAVFDYDEDEDGKRAMKIGWRVENSQTPYNGLSGGEKQIFDAAMANVLDSDIIVVEAAELDSENFQKTLQELAKLDKQVLVNTCHPVDAALIPDNFEIVEVW